MGKRYIKAGFGYWNVSRHPIGGDFRRATERELVELVKPLQVFSNGAPSMWEARVGTETLAVPVGSLTDETLPDEPPYGAAHGQDQ